MLQNSNRSLSNWRTGLSEASLGSGPRSICNLCHFENNLLLCLFPKIEFLQKREVKLENDSVCLRSKQKWIRSQQANMATGQELNAIHALASWNFFSPAIIEGGGSAYSHPNKKILYLGQASTCLEGSSSENTVARRTFAIASTAK
ncbi:hypothetical protein WN943_015315 [Citrus x changshan-huyou]